jgi:DNA-binding PadR family transcriptional regulator
MRRPELTGTARLILGMIRQGARTGYEIKRRVEVSTRFFWSASPGQIYPELRRLEANGLVSRSEEPRGDRPRSVYSLTPLGAAALHEWLLDPELAFELRNEGLLKLFFADALSEEEALGIVRTMRARHEAKLAAIRAAGFAYREEYKFAYITWRYGLGIQAWIAAWCEELERDLLAGRVPFERRTDELAASAR